MLKIYYQYIKTHSIHTHYKFNCFNSNKHLLNFLLLFSKNQLYNGISFIVQKIVETIATDCIVSPKVNITNLIALCQNKLNHHEI